MADSDTKREMLRHTVATLAYRGTKAVRGASDSFASFKASETTRTPAQILAHIAFMPRLRVSMNTSPRILSCQLVVNGSFRDQSLTR